jgi:hypothetical protein
VAKRFGPIGGVESDVRGATCKAHVDALCERHSIMEASPYGQVSFAIPRTPIDMAPGGAAFADATAITSTVPEAPRTHCAKPDGEMVAISRFETLQLPE